MNSHVENFEEGPVARAIEHQTAKLPSDIFLWAALASIATSLVLQILDRKKNALFVGQWAPTFLLLGIYNKLVRVLGSDRHDQEYRGNPAQPTLKSDRRRRQKKS